MLTRSLFSTAFGTWNLTCIIIVNGIIFIVECRQRSSLNQHNYTWQRFKCNVTGGHGKKEDYNNVEDEVIDANQGSASNSEAVALFSGSQTRMCFINCRKWPLFAPVSFNTFSSSSNFRRGTFISRCLQHHSLVSLIQLWRTSDGECRRKDTGGLPISATISATSCG